MAKLEGWDLGIFLDEQVDELRMLEDLPLSRPPRPPTQKDEYQDFLLTVRPMRSDLEWPQGLTSGEVAQVRQRERGKVRRWR